MDISVWINRIIDGPSGLHAFEHFERATPTVPRDEAVAAWVIRCLANPECDGSADLLAAIQRRREKVEKRGV